MGERGRSSEIGYRKHENNVLSSFLLIVLQYSIVKNISKIVKTNASLLAPLTHPISASYKIGLTLFSFFSDTTEF